VNENDNANVAVAVTVTRPQPSVQNCKDYVRNVHGTTNGKSIIVLISTQQLNQLITIKQH
jgi:hypothetical protein